jgi:hypothetical protein
MMSTTEQLRHDIDSGRTGDKVRVGDPAAAPLGTDDEAAASPPSRAAIATARDQEGRGPSQQPRNGLGAAWILIVIILLLAGAVLFWLAL